MSTTDLPPTDAPPDRPSPTLSVARWAAAGVVLALVVASFWQARKPAAQLADFGAYYRAGHAVAAGRSPYTIDPTFGPLGAYMYCPAFAHWACRPLARLSYVSAMRAFLAANWLATVAVVALSVRPVRKPPRSGGLTDGFWVGLIALASVGTYLWADLHNGQVGTLLLLACLGWLSLTAAGRPMLGGASLSLAVGLKIYPLLLAPYLLLRRQWWPGLVGLAVGLVIQFAAPALFVGSRGLLPLHREWLQFCLHTQIPEQTFRAGNQSLLGVLARTPSISDGVHLFSPDRLKALEGGYPIIVLAITAAAYGLIVARRTRDPVLDVSLLLIWMTLASPRAWTFNFCGELPAAVLLARAVVDRRPGWPLAVVGLLAPLWAVTLNTNRLGVPHGWSAGTQFLFDKHFVAAVILAGATAAVVRPTGPARTSRPSPAGPAPAGTS